jgi:hypothetical protein
MCCIANAWGNQHNQQLIPFLLGAHIANVNAEKTIYPPRIVSYIGLGWGSLMGLRGLQADPSHLTQFVLP